MDPAKRTPIRICDFKKSDWQKQKERRDRNQDSGERPAIICGLRPLTSDLWVGPVLPAQPKKIEREKGDEPSVIILLVERPFAAEFSTEEKPERADDGDNQRGASETAIVLCGYGLCLGENGIQFALIISQEPKDESAAATGRRMFSAARCYGIRRLHSENPIASIECLIASDASIAFMCGLPFTS